MTARFRCSHRVRGSATALFDLARDVEVHLETMAVSGERAVGGVTSGLLELGDQVTWAARHFGVPWRMTVGIVEYDRPARFVDEQVRGPFRRFRHVHIFEPDGDHVTIVDDVGFAAPFGILGRAVEPLLVRYLRRLVCDRTEQLVARVAR
jgi:ligand-binding SRPBCC domain-containing protein